MIHNLQGIHETVDYKADTQICLYYNKEAENYPPHWHPSFEVIMPIINDYRVVCGHNDYLIKEGEILVSIDTYKNLNSYILEYDKFKINRQKYYNDIKQATIASNETQEASHGLRWNFAKRRMFEYGKAGYSYEECLQQVSYEMKHNRASITQHYLA